MHGVIFSELRRYADDRLGPDSWRDLLREAGLGPRIYLAVQAYPDAEAIALVGAAAARAGLPVPAVLEDFGVFIAPTLLSMYKSLITLDVLEHTEQTIHAVVRMRNPGAVPAVLSCRRDASDSLVLTYTSERRLCPLAIGIIKGLTAHFGEDIAVDQTQCMYDGADVHDGRPDQGIGRRAGRVGHAGWPPGCPRAPAAPPTPRACPRGTCRFTTATSPSRRRRATSEPGSTG